MVGNSMGVAVYCGTENTAFGKRGKTSASSESVAVSITEGASLAGSSDPWLDASRVVFVKRSRVTLRIIPALTAHQAIAAGSRRCGDSTVRYYFEFRIISVPSRCVMGATFAIGFEAGKPEVAQADAPLCVAWRELNKEHSNAAPGAATARLLWTSDGVLQYDGRSIAFPSADSGAMYAIGDVVGLGVDEATGSVCFTKNGRLIMPPRVSLTGRGPSQPTESKQSSPSKKGEVETSDDTLLPAVRSSSPWLQGLLIGQGPLTPVATVYSAAQSLTAGGDVADGFVEALSRL